MIQTTDAPRANYDVLAVPDIMTSVLPEKYSMLVSLENTRCHLCFIPSKMHLSPSLKCHFTNHYTKRNDFR